MGYRHAFTFSGIQDIPESACFETGPVRFKFRFDGRIEVRLFFGSEPYTIAPTNVAVELSRSVGVGLKPAFSRQISGTVSVGIGANLSERTLTAMGQNMDPLEMGRELLKAMSVEAKFDLPSSAYLNSVTVSAGFDSDLCFVGATLEQSTKVLEYEERYRDGQTLKIEARMPARFGIKAGLSRSAWLALGVRFGGPATSALIQRIAPGAVAQALATWVTPLNVAVPVGIAIRDLSVWICRAAWARGLDEGRWRFFARAYVARVYNLRPPTVMANYRSAQRHAVEASDDHVRRLGLASVQRSLERAYLDGTRLPYPPGPAEDPRFDLLVQRFGNALASGAPMAVGQNY